MSAEICYAGPWDNSAHAKAASATYQVMAELHMDVWQPTAEAIARLRELAGEDNPYVSDPRTQEVPSETTLVDLI